MARVQHLGRIMLIAGGIQGAGLLANAAVTSFVPGLGNSALRWIAPTAIALTVSMAQAGAEAVASERVTEPRRRGHREASGVPAVLGFAVIVVVVGVLGLALVAGVRYAVGWATGDEPVTGSRLAATVSGSVGHLRAEVIAIDETRHFTKVSVVITNDGERSVSLPLYGNVQLSPAVGQPLEPHRLALSSGWSTSTAAGTSQTGVMTFAGHLPAGTTTARLTFHQVFGPGALDDPGSFGKSLVVDGIPLKGAEL